MERTYSTMNEETRRILARLEELCSGVPENEFDSWLRKRFYPVLAAMPRTVDVQMEMAFHSHYHHREPAVLMVENIMKRLVEL